MPNTMTLIASSTVGAGGAGTITFSSIPSTYTDLVLLVSPRSNRSGGVWNGVALTFNGSSTSYSSKIVEGGDGSATSANGLATYLGLNSTGLLFSSTFGSSQVYIPNYAGSTNKSVSIETLNEGNQANGVYLDLNAGLWSNTSAITSITLTSLSTGTSFEQYSTAYLYGVKNA